MTKPRILSEKRPTAWPDSDLNAWDLERREAEQKYADYLFRQPVESLSAEDWAFLEAVAPEVPIN